MVILNESVREIETSFCAHETVIIHLPCHTTTYTANTITVLTPHYAPYSTYAVGIEQGTEFTVILESHRNAGYEWREYYDAGMLSLVEHVFNPYITYTPGGPAAVGVGGKEVYRFKALKAGGTTLNFECSQMDSHRLSERATYEVEIIG